MESNVVGFNKPNSLKHTSATSRFEIVFKNTLIHQEYSWSITNYLWKNIYLLLLGINMSSFVNTYSDLYYLSSRTNIHNMNKVVYICLYIRIIYRTQHELMNWMLLGLTNPALWKTHFEIWNSPDNCPNFSCNNQLWASGRVQLMQCNDLNRWFHLCMYSILHFFLIRPSYSVPAGLFFTLGQLRLWLSPFSRITT